jgi:DNA polymerase III delta prime subunit
MTITMADLERCKKRREAGESYRDLAAELSVSRQLLEKAVRHGRLPGSGKITAKPGGLWTEKYRPQKFDALCGQPDVSNRLRAFAAAPYPVAMLFSGETGTGKTSAALALAAGLGCALNQKEFGGVHILASGEQTADSVRECCAQMHLMPFQGSGWKVFIVNECDRMHVQAETIWLDRLENIPNRTVVVFTTNHPDKLSQRFRDRCLQFGFESSAEKLHDAARKLLAELWKREVGSEPLDPVLETILSGSTVNGHLSFRRAVQLLQTHTTRPSSKNS